MADGVRMLRQKSLQYQYQEFPTEPTLENADDVACLLHAVRAQRQVDPGRF